MLEYVILAAGIVFLLKGADLLVEGSSILAKRFGISELVIGLTVVAFGTSMPELMVNMFAATTNATDVAIGNILGSNIANVLLILGCSAMIYPLVVKKSTIWREVPLFFLSALVLLVVVNDVALTGASANVMNRIDGIILLLFFGIYMLYVVGMAIGQHEESKSGKKKKPKAGKKAYLMVIVGLVGLYFGGSWTVDGAVSIAQSLGISTIVISSTIVAVGTSLPELITSVVAALKKKPDISIGNVVGSNIFNTFMILGTTAVITPIYFYQYLNLDILILMGSSILLFLFILRRNVIQRWEGLVFVLIYALYIAMLLIRG